ncbi:MAG: bifunctional chorismate mutase/prephenate dehydrogenase [Steroidobacteraceae bacterium]
MALEDLRRQLDGIDKRLVELIAERQATIRGIAEVKRSTSFPLRDYGREREVLQRGRANAEAAGVSPDVAEDMLRLLIRYSLTQQEQASTVAHRAGSGKRALIIGGGGKMGGWFARFLYSQGFDIEIADPGAAPADNVITDWQTSDLSHDFIIVATPLGRTNEVLSKLAQRKPKGVVFDLGSLKSPLATGLQELQAAGVRVTSLHPMFGPDAELLSGRHIIFVDLGAGDALACSQALFAPTMAEQIVMELKEHDRFIAYVLGLSHAVNIAFFTALRQSGESAPRLVELSSTTFDAQFDIARRVAQENPQLYYEIQRLNEFGQQSLDALLQAVQTIRTSVVDGDAEQFHALMNAGREYTENRRKSPARRR